MGCRSDYLEATQSENHSKEVAQHLVYVLTHLKKEVPDYVTKAANNYYGDTNKLHTMVVELCDILTHMKDKTLNEIVYNAKDKQSRALADWWETHQEADRKRIEKEKADVKTQKKLDEIKKKLTPAEIKMIKKFG